MAQEHLNRAGSDIHVIYRKITDIQQTNGANYNGFNPSTTTLSKGHLKEAGRRALQVDTLWERDVEIPLRDGTILRADVFRPAETSKPIPALIAFAPFGKSGTGVHQLDLVPGRAGIPKHALSGYENFEAPDPAEWCQHGYAIVNVDDRGIFASQGNHTWHGSAQGRDGYDTIEHIASLDWCNNRVALIGNSWLATSQWFIASQRPPHLTCILPLEGLSDVYRETLCRGGVPYVPFWNWLMHNLRGHNSQEDVIAMIEKYPLMNGYWEDKRAEAHLIDVPAYVLASMSTGLHTVGSIRCFEDIPHSKKWLRIHPTQEWHDLYQPDTITDLKKFLDFYTKGVGNGWEETPRVRVSPIRYNKPPIYDLSFTAWPIPEARYQTLWLSVNQNLETASQKTTAGAAEYQSDVATEQVDKDTEHAEWVHTFSESSTVIGPSKVTLYMSCFDHDDMDVFVILRKADTSGKLLSNLNIPLRELPFTTEEEVPDLNILKYIGPSGILRASHRAIDETLSKPHWHAHDHSREDRIPAGTIVKLEIMVWPAAIHFEAGEKLVLRVAGHQMTLAEFEMLRGGFNTSNKGRHIVHFGELYHSRVEIPLVSTASTTITAA